MESTVAPEAQWASEISPKARVRVDKMPGYSPPGLLLGGLNATGGEKGDRPGRRESETSRKEVCVRGIRMALLSLTARMTHWRGAAAGGFSCPAPPQCITRGRGEGHVSFPVAAGYVGRSVHPERRELSVRNLSSVLSHGEETGLSRHRLLAFATGPARLRVPWEVRPPIIGRSPSPAYSCMRPASRPRGQPIRQLWSSPEGCRAQGFTIKANGKNCSKTERIPQPPTHIFAG